MSNGYSLRNEPEKVCAINLTKYKLCYTPAISATDYTLLKQLQNIFENSEYRLGIFLFLADSASVKE